MNAFWENVSDGVLKKKINGEIIFHWDSIVKGYIIAIERLDKNFCQIQAWKHFVHICVVHQISFWEAQNIVYEGDSLCSITPESNELKVCISLKGNKLACFVNWLWLISGTRFVWFTIFVKSITRCVFLCG